MCRRKWCCSGNDGADAEITTKWEEEAEQEEESCLCQADLASKKGRITYCYYYVSSLAQVI